MGNPEVIYGWKKKKERRIDWRQGSNTDQAIQGFYDNILIIKNKFHNRWSQESPQVHEVCAKPNTNKTIQATTILLIPQI